jgi:NitT/TauT family transport system substrate-binding protein
MKIRHFMALSAGVLLFLLGLYFMFREHSQGNGTPGAEGLPVFRVYTAPTTTTPQLGLWAAYQDGFFDGMFELETVLWKDIDDFQAAMLAGRGDIWIGHTEGMAYARQRGAPVVLLAVTAWRKFYVLSRNPAIQSVDDLYGRALPYAPSGSPAVPLLQALPGAASERIDFQPQEARQLALLLQREKIETVCVPEPLATILLHNVPGLRVAFSIEDLYGQYTPYADRIPVAGIAVHERLLREQPNVVRRLQEGIVTYTRRLAEQPGLALSALPETFREYVPDSILADSLERDVLQAEPAGAVRDELAAYLRMVAPALVRPDGSLDMEDAFFGEEL